MDHATFQTIVTRANLAPSIHNAQPTRWRRVGGTIQIAADDRVILPQADPDGRGIALSVGAAIEATVLALGAHGLTAEVTITWAQDDHSTWHGHRLAAILTPKPGDAPPLDALLDQRLTWRGRFDETPVPPLRWNRDDTLLIENEAARRHIAELNDAAALETLRRPAFRKELLSWMRLTPRHPRFRHDGLSSENLRLQKGDAKRLTLGYGPLWGMMDAMGRTKALTGEADLTMTAPIIAFFHAPKGACLIETGRAYLTMWLEATEHGLAGWPMTALSDDPEVRATLATRYAIPPDRDIVQVLRLGRITGRAPARTRRPLHEVAL